MKIGNIVKFNFAATAPTATDDSSLGYAVGSRWFNSSTGLLYFATDVTPTSAVWRLFRREDDLGLERLPKLHVEDLGLIHNSVTDILILSGQCRDGDDGINMVLDSTATVDISVSGSVNQLDTGTVSADTFYTVWLISDSAGVNPTGGLFSLSETTPTLPTGYDTKRRIGWIKTNASSEIIDFVQFQAGRFRYYNWLNTFSDRQVLAAGSATTPTAIDFSDWMPTSTIHMAARIRNDSGTRTARLYDATGTVIVYEFSPDSSAVSSITPTINQEVLYDNDGTGGSVDAHAIGWMETI